jgi:hypothetical protein
MPYHTISRLFYALKMGDCKVSCSHSPGRLQEPEVEVSTVLIPSSNTNTHTAIFN